MVALKDIKAANAQLTADTAPRVAVFAGATSGIAKATIERIAALGFPTKIYIIARPSSKETIDSLIEDVRKTNPKAELIWTPGEISLLSETKRICEQIREAETYIDLLFLAAGYAAFSGRNNTSEGLDVTHALEWYGRCLFTQLLLPLLRESCTPRVVSVLSGTFLRAIDDSDLNLEKPGAFGGFASQTHMGAMNTLGLDRIAASPENSHVTFVHGWPGAVDTGNIRRHWTPAGRWMPFSLTDLVKPVFWIMGTSFEETGERHLFMSTSGSYGGGFGPRAEGFEAKNTKGGTEGGLFLVDNKCEAKFDKAMFDKLKTQSQEKIWAKTSEILAPFL